MFTRLDHLIVAVKDLEKAEDNYKKLFGIVPVWKGKHKDFGTSNSLFNFFPGMSVPIYNLMRLSLNNL